MNRGDTVDVTIGGRVVKGTVLYVRDGSVRVELADGRKVTRPLARVKPERAATVPASLGVGPLVDLSRYPTPHLSMPATRSVPKPPKRWESAEYREYIRCRPRCVACNDGRRALDPMEASHHGRRGSSGVARKSDDSTCVPLHASCHRYYHDHGTFQGMSRETTDAVAASAAAQHLRTWCVAKGLDADHAIIDALTAQLRESA